MALPLRLWLRLRSTRWETEHWPDFEDTQKSGPYSLWQHSHEFKAIENGTLISDQVRYALPLGPLSGLAQRLIVHRDLNAIFDYRTKMTADIFANGGQLRRLNDSRFLLLHCLLA